MRHPHAPRGRRALPPCALLLTTLVTLTGCMERELAELEPRTSRFFRQPAGGDGTALVDLLFVIDDSNSMRQEQDNLRDEIPDLVRGLTDPPTDPETGEPAWNPVERLRVAIVTSDMGTRGQRVDTGRVGAACAANDYLGGDGVPVRDERGAIAVWETGDDPGAFSARVGAMADVGISGCGLEMPLAAGSSGLDAVEAELGAPFPAEDALLAVVVLSDEEDCSLADPPAFFAGDEVGTALNQRCVREPGLLAPVAGLVASLRAGRDPERFLFAALVGVPEDLADAGFDAILADPRMAYRLTDANQLGLEEACRSENGFASPGRRYVELARQLGEGSLVRSICAESFEPAIEELTRRIGTRLSSVCANRALTPAEDGSVDCRVRETLPEGMRCAELPARTRIGQIGDDPATAAVEPTREICEVAQAVGDQPSGWRYDASDAACEQLLFTEDAIPPFGTRVDFECLVDVELPAGPDPEGPTG